MQQHHEPDGMIALCSEHHDKADAGAYTKEQLHRFKRLGASRAEEVKGKFDWMRHRLLAVVEGNFFYETPIVFQFQGERSIWFERDEDGYLLLNVRMLTTSGQPRMRIEDNFWLTRGDPEDLESPPSGKLLSVKYPNGDTLRVRFVKLASVAAAQRRYPTAQAERWNIPFPITAVEIHSRVGGTNVWFGPRHTNLPSVGMRDCFAAHCHVGLSLG